MRLGLYDLTQSQMCISKSAIPEDRRSAHRVPPHTQQFRSPTTASQRPPTPNLIASPLTTPCASLLQVDRFLALLFAMSSATHPAGPLKIIILGPTGLAGSAISIELLNRGHHVTGIPRNPEKLGENALYSTKKVDLLRKR